MQSLACDKMHGNIRTVMSTMIREEGLFRPMKGVSAMAMGAGPAHAMYFAALEKTRDLLTSNNVPLHVASGELSSYSRLDSHCSILIYSSFQVPPQ